MKVYEFNETLQKYDPDDEIYLVVNREGIIERITIESVDKYCRNTRIKGGEQWMKAAKLADAVRYHYNGSSHNGSYLAEVVAEYTDQFLGITGVAPRKETNNE
jgi:predicted TIM-barrel fold metal-dependent hydrolase